MSKLTTRIVLSVLISIGVIVGVYTSVQGASPWAERAGAHPVSGANVNLDHYRSVDSQQGSLDAPSGLLSPDGSGKGHGCESEARSNPSDL